MRVTYLTLFENSIGDMERAWRTASKAQTERFLFQYGTLGRPIEIGGKYYTDEKELHQMSAWDRMRAAKKDFVIYADYMLKEHIESDKLYEGKKYVAKPEIKMCWDSIYNVGFTIKCPECPIG